jgi:hypothetical protein
MTKQPSIGRVVNDATEAIDRDNEHLKGMLHKDHARLRPSSATMRL